VNIHALCNTMSRIEEYRRARELCEANATSAPWEEMRDLWRTMAGSYAFLIGLELQPRTGLVSVDRDAGDVRPAPDGPPSAGGRIRP
jgi:hypothetical protein